MTSKKAKYGKLHEHERFDEIENLECDKSASRAAALELKLLRQSVQKLGAESKILSAKNQQLEDIHENLTQELNSSKHRNINLTKRLEVSRKDCKKARNTVTIQSHKIEAMKNKIESLSENLREFKDFHNINEKFKTTKTRLKTSLAENSQLKSQLELAKSNTMKEVKNDSEIKEKLEKLTKDNHQKKTLIDDLRAKIKIKERELAMKNEVLIKTKDDVEDKTSSNLQKKRANENLRRQIQDMKVEKNALTGYFLYIFVKFMTNPLVPVKLELSKRKVKCILVELNCVRERLVNSEQTEASLKIELENLDNEISRRLEDSENEKDLFFQKHQKGELILKLISLKRNL